ncbi:DsbA family protein [Tritonibacter horizontis]|uniref:Disulfide bond formation protein D n=1 Tax=Tritonibacter horizontis TaxID=1768241 RepID=A0A132C3B8_9RHOB|nr:DsbA family protein [Tritonibacter horizontis]KUP95016.1 disulfide bond formation protein D precursor [Tritonibacter horizontis]
MTRLMTGICAAVAISAGAYAINTYMTRTGETSLLDLDLVGMAEAQEAVDAADIDTSTIVEMAQGAEDAPVTLIEYASYTCPHCASFHADSYKKLKADFIETGKVKFVYREVYFDRFGLWASMVARCGGQEKFFGITDMIFEKQSEWTRAGGPGEIVDELKKIGRLAGLENEQLDVCMQDATKAQTLVTWYQENATADDISSTPSFLLNGTKMSNQPYPEIKALIEAELDG